MNIPISSSEELSMKSVALDNQTMQSLHITPPTELVEKARKGDQDAFGELVRLHREKALGWAQSITKDTFLAEDIVQDALIRAFLKLGTLMDTKKFLPWLRQIVRNQAYMKMRRGGPYRNEQPFALFTQSNEEGTIHAQRVDWSDVDQILFFMSRSSREHAKQKEPIAYLLRAEIMENIRSLLHCLTDKERSIFEAHFFGELTPVDIAGLFGMQTANVYNLLSRSKRKVQRERIRISINDYVKNRARAKLPAKKILAPPPDF
ncbi:RNA polymerase sigma factor [Ornithinibacillus bavariensis]|uniref:RNA polymerase sigma factor n=1 Tax=Ornithinibacillus bavariensis TaxID=545502 RepID=UPI000EB909D7|nr:RNA polymerase sigma factor [Ornithinibacillus sp.]